MSNLVTAFPSSDYSDILVLYSINSEKYGYLLTLSRRGRKVINDVYAKYGRIDEVYRIKANDMIHSKIKDHLIGNYEAISLGQYTVFKCGICNIRDYLANITSSESELKSVTYLLKTNPKEFRTTDSKHATHIHKWVYDKEDDEYWPIVYMYSESSGLSLQD